MSFNSLGLSAEILRAVTDKGYDQPTPIQIQAIPVVLEGRDLLAGAQTGTGKTAGFTLPLLQRLMVSGHKPEAKFVRALILTPTRELAAQVEESVRTYGKHLPLKSAVIFGGVGFTPQAEALRRGLDILVATPGRLLDHVTQRTIDLSRVEILVLDEADRMLDMGFIRDIRKILALLPKQRQNLLFSATFSDEIKQLSDTLLNSPALIEVARRNTAAELVTQVVHPVDRGRKRELLSHLIHTQGWKQVLVFTRTKHGANRLAEQLEKDGITSAAIHGNKSQGARTRALSDFKQGAVRVLVATDIAARGLDIDQLPHVVNYELPNVPEDYVHRIGRTGRAGNEGEAMSLVCVDELGFLRDIERLLHREIPKAVIEGYEPDLSVKPEPIVMGRGGQRNPRQSGAPRHARNPHGQGGRGGRGGQGGRVNRAPDREESDDHSQQPLDNRNRDLHQLLAQPGQPRGPRRSSSHTPRPQQNLYREARPSGPRPERDIGNVLKPEVETVHDEVDGNRLIPETPARPAPRGEHRGRPSGGRPQQSSNKPRSGKPQKNVHARREREIPALFGGGKRED